MRCTQQSCLHAVCTTCKLALMPVALPVGATTKYTTCQPHSEVAWVFMYLSSAFASPVQLDG